MTSSVTHSSDHESRVFQTNELVDINLEKDSLEGEPLNEPLAAINEATQLASTELSIDDPNSLEVVDATERILLHKAEDSVASGDPHKESIRHIEAAATFGLLRSGHLLPSSENENVITVMNDEGLHDELLEIENYFAKRDVMIGNTYAANEMQKIIGQHLDVGNSVAAGVEYVNDISPERTGNYRGNWTQAQTDRMKSDDFLAKFAEFTTRGATELPESIYTDLRLTKNKVLQADYLKRIDNYSTLHDNVTNRISYVPASDRGREPKALGTAKYGMLDSEVALFSDAALDNRQKDIIAAHEMNHGLIDPQGSNVEEIRSAFDFYKVTEFNQRAKLNNIEKRAPLKYMQNASELIARMAQVKNYFGMKSNEQFTINHLRYAREHYVTDTNLDNNMSLFLEMADDDRFVKLMNTIPV